VMAVLIYCSDRSLQWEKASEVGREFLLKGLGLLGNVIVIGLIFLVLRYLLLIFNSSLKY
jgi:hypothetical protein